MKRNFHNRCNSKPILWHRLANILKRTDFQSSLMENDEDNDDNEAGEEAEEAKGKEEDR